MKPIILTALAGLLVACGQTTDTTHASSEPTETGATTVAPVTVTRAGTASGRTVVLIPGLASGTDVWDDTADVLSDYDLRLVQVAGFAGSPPVEALDMATLVTAITQHFADAPARDAVLIGHSLGGVIALQTALDHPNTVSEIIVVDSLPFVAAIFMPGATPDDAALRGPAMAEMMKAAPPEQFAAQQAMSAPTLTVSERNQARVVAWGQASDQATVATLMGELLARDLRPAMPALSVPLTLIYPRPNGLPSAQVDALYAGQYAGVADKTLVPVENSLHFVMLDQPDAFHAAVTKALED